MILVDGPVLIDSAKRNRRRLKAPAHRNQAVMRASLQPPR